MEHEFPADMNSSEVREVLLGARGNNLHVLTGTNGSSVTPGQCYIVREERFSGESYYELFNHYDSGAEIDELEQRYADNNYYSIVVRGCITPAQSPDAPIPLSCNEFGAVSSTGEISGQEKIVYLTTREGPNEIVARVQGDEGSETFLVQKVNYDSSENEILQQEKVNFAALARAVNSQCSGSKSADPTLLQTIQEKLMDKFRITGNGKQTRSRGAACGMCRG
jgi:hypothetical protein